MPISLEALKLFEPVILPDFEGLQTPIFVPTEFVIKYLNSRKNIERILHYVEAGGGLFFSPLMRGSGEEVAEGCEPILKPLSASVHSAQIRDDAHSGCNREYSWTTNIANSPLTSGVRTLWYPTNMLRWNDAYATVPLVLDETQWEVLVRGMPESTSAKALHYTTWLPIKSDMPPIISAVRTFGKGRVAVLAVSVFYTLWLPFAKPARGLVRESHTGRIDGIFLEKGDRSRPSDGWKLIINTLKWLAEGSRRAGLGGYTAEPFQNAPRPPSAQLPSWLSVWREDTSAKPIKVLIGARSSLNDGKASIAELAETARACGYSILVMTETFKALSRDNWEELVKACRKQSTDDFFILLGIDIADQYDNRFLISSGPVILTLTRDTIVAESSSPIKEVKIINKYYAERRWLPNSTRAELRYHFPPLISAPASSTSRTKREQPPSLLRSVSDPPHIRPGAAATDRTSSALL